MYESHWGLKAAPFQNVPDPNFFFLSDQHREGLARLLYTVRHNKGAALLIGDVGCGKTTLSRAFIVQLAEEKYDIGLITNPSLPGNDFLEEIDLQLGIIPSSTSKVAMLRARRKTVSSPFGWLCVAMHGAIVVLLVFITEVVGTFATMVAKASASMPKIAGAPSMGAFVSFNFAGLELMRSIVLPLVIVFTVANALAPSIADGGSRYKFLYGLGITSLISGVCLIILPMFARKLFSGVGM